MDIVRTQTTYLQMKAFSDNGIDHVTDTGTPRIIPATFRKGVLAISLTVTGFLADGLTFSF